MQRTSLNNRNVTLYALPSIKTKNQNREHEDKALLLKN